MTRLEKLYNFYENDKTDSFIIFAIAKEYEKLDDLNSAKDWLIKLREEHSDYIGLYYHLGKVYEKLELFKEAQVIYSEGMVIAKSTNDFHAASELNSAKMNLEILMNED